MSSATASAAAAGAADAPDTMQLEVLEDDDDDSPIDEELVLATDEPDDDDADGEHVRRKKASRFSLPRINLGRKGKAKYSRVTAEHIASTAHSKSVQPVLHTPNGTHRTHSPSAAFAASHDERGSGGACCTCFNVCLFVSICLTIFCAGFIGYVIGRRALSGTSSHSQLAAHNRLIVLSLDGFASVYVGRHRALLPNLTAIVASGLSALPLTPVFPSLTFPNHYTLVTGLYPTEHGIVANRMYNASSDEWFEVGRTLTNASYWWLGEPIWSTAQQHGLASAVLNWPGSDKLIGGRRPNVWAPYNGSISNSDRVLQLMTWLDTNACTLCMVYFSTVDEKGHEYGPLSPSMESVLAAMDATVGSVVSGLQQRGLWDSVNLMIVSDHGMTSVNTSDAPDNDKLVLLDRYTNVTDYTLVYSGPIAHILPSSPAAAVQLYSDLQQEPMHNCTVYWNASGEDIPAQYHYSFHDSARIQPIVLICDLGVRVTNTTYWTGNERTLLGAHGYLGTEEEMGAILMVHGAGVSDAGVNVKLSGTQSVDVYALMCQLLGVTPARNDGDMHQFIPYLT